MLDFPEPVPPMMPMVSPGAASKEISFKICLLLPYPKETLSNETLPSFTSVTGSCGLTMSGCSSSTAQMRSAAALAIVSIMTIMDSIIKLIRICCTYVMTDISWPVVMVLETTIFAPIQEISSMQTYMEVCIRGPLNAMMRSPLTKLRYSSPETFWNFSFSSSSRTNALTTRMPRRFSCTTAFRRS